MATDGEVKFIPEKHRDSDTSDGSNHLMVTGLYDDDAQERKSSISFDKIKQISLTYSLQGSEDEPDRNLPLDGEIRRESAGSYCLSPADGEASDVSRKVSVIDLRNVTAAERCKLKTQVEVINSNNNDSSNDSNIRIDHQKDATKVVEPIEHINGGGGSGVMYANSPRYPETNPFVYEESDYEFSDHKTSEEINYKPSPTVSDRDEFYDYEGYKRNLTINNPQNMATNQVNRHQINQYNRSPVDGHRSGLIRRNVNMSNVMAVGENISYSPRRKQSPQARSKSTFVQARDTAELEGRRKQLSGGEGVDSIGLLTDGTPLQGSPMTLDHHHHHHHQNNKQHSLRSAHYQRPRSSASDRSLGSNSGASVGLKLKQHNNSISVVLFNETDSNIIISDDPESLSDESYEFDSAAVSATTNLRQQNHRFQHDGLHQNHQGELGIDYNSEEELMNGLGANNRPAHHLPNHRYHHDSKPVAGLRDENFIVSGSSMATAGRVPRQIPTMRSSNQRGSRRHHNHRHQDYQNHHDQYQLANEKFDSQHKTNQKLMHNYQLRDGYDDDNNNSSTTTLNNHQKDLLKGSSRPFDRSAEDHYQKLMLNQDRNTNNSLAHHNQASEYRAQVFALNHQQEPATNNSSRQYRMAANSDKSAANLIGQLKESSGNEVRTKNSIRNGADHSLVRSERIQADNFLYKEDDLGVKQQDTKPSQILADGSRNEHEVLRNDSRQLMDSNNKHSNSAADEGGHHEYDQPTDIISDRGRIPQDANNDITFASYTRRPKPASSPFADSEFVTNNSIYASPIRRPLSKVTNDYLDDRRRIDIVISSPKRYNRTNKRQLNTSRYWDSATIPADAADLQKDSNMFVEHLYHQPNSGRRSGELQRTNRIVMDHYQNSPPSSNGSHSGWSNTGSYARELDKAFIVDSQSRRSSLGGPNEGYSEDSLKSLNRAQQNQKMYKQQQQMKQNNTDDDASSKFCAGGKIAHPHSAAQINSNCLDETFQPDIVKSSTTNNQIKQADGFLDENKDKLEGKQMPLPKTEQSTTTTTTITSDLVQANLKNNQIIARERCELMDNNANKSEKSPEPKPMMGTQSSGCPFISSNPPKPIKLRNLINGEQTVDNLNGKYKVSNSCTDQRCLGALMNPRPAEHKVRPLDEVLEQARDFINNFYLSTKRMNSPAHKTRIAEIEEQIRTTETYYLKETELIYGAKLAWRNASRCIGRIQWSKLQVFDARFTTNASEMFEALCNHIKYATNKGSLRSAITILPQRVKSTKNDWRIWNNQLIGYAGYRNKETGQVIGDPINADFTEVCQKLGWKGKGTKFDILPLVLSAKGGPPELFPLPEDLVMRVKIKHPKYKWFEELGLEWYALPAVANMMLDVGGLQFTAAPFSGWYMVTEIGTRDLGDTSRYNMLEEVAQRMGLNTTSNMSLWKDQAVVELNIAVLDSFQKAGVTIVDHHTASETFMTHLANEQRLRGGCPADWVWLVPPTSGSTTQVFHQEMVNYHLLPNYEYMEPVSKTFDWLAWEKLQQDKLDDATKKRNSIAVCSPTNGLPLSPSSKVLNANGELTPRKLRFKEIARAVKFTSKLFGKALSRRIKATILYATETGKSERFANKLAQTFSCAFNVHLMSMSDYDLTCLEHEALLMIVTSTFGNGDPPENGELFAKHLAAVKLTGDTSPDIDSINSVSTNPFFQMLSEDQKDGGISSDEKDDDSNENLLKLPDKQEQQTNIRPLSNVRFGVFALGSTAYPHFCAFGRYVDQTLGELGAERIHKCTCGDELCGQEKAFNEWSKQIFRTACDVFCLTDSIGPIEERSEFVWSPQDVKFVPVELIAGGVGSNESDKNNNNPTNLNGSVHEQMKQLDLNQTPTITTKPSRDVLTSKKTIMRNLMNITNKKIIPFTMKDRRDLHKFREEENLQTICLDLESDWISGPGGASLMPTLSINSNSIITVGGGFVNSSTGTKQPNSPSQITFEAGDHVAIYPTNKLEMVEKILDRMRNDVGGDKANDKQASFDFDQVYTILVKRENMDLTPAPSAMNPGGPLGENSWITHDRLPVTSIREALTRYLDITSPPNQEFLLILSRQTTDLEERKRLQQMARNFTIYEEWKNKKVPTLLSVLEEFKTIKFEPSIVTQIPLMKPRFYSVSGTSVSLTVGVVRFKTSSGELREGICSNYLNTVAMDPSTYIFGYIRSAPAFHMPQDKSVPMILISAGTGLAPFRSFWQQRYADMYKGVTMQQLNDTRQQQQGATIKTVFGRIDLYFGCRNSNYILYKDELDEMYRNGVLSTISIAFSRPIDHDVLDECSQQANSDGIQKSLEAAGSKVASIKQARKKMYVQDRLLEDSDHIYRLIMLDGAHVYVCGDVAMADGVYKTLTSIFNNSFRANKSTDKPSSADSILDSGLSGELARSDDGESVLMNLRNLNRYHEDIFGAKQMS